jgi:hypothetical protein
MQKYHSFYPTLRQAKTRWSKPSLVTKQGEGPSHDWYEMMKADARKKLAKSIRVAKFGDLHKQTKIVHEDVASDVIYHVTHTQHVAKIQKHGIMPMKTSNWVKAGDKERYGGGEVYAFTHKDDAHQWAGRMDWAHHQKLGSGKISIVTAHRPKDREFEVDHNDPLSQAGKKGDWLKTRGGIEPHHIVSVEKYMPKKLGEDKIGKPTKSAEEIAKKHGISVDAVNAQIKKGIEVEKEHTDDEGMADEIARDHLGEFPDYYDRLGAMEKAAKKAQVKEAKKNPLKGYKMFTNDPPVPKSNTASPVTLKGYERVKDGKFNVLRKIQEEIEGNASNSKGVLHELLVGYHMRGGKHMTKHPDANGDSPKQAHDKHKAAIHPDEYKEINTRAKAAAADIHAAVAKHGKFHDVHWTSKAGDLHRSTGIHATQKEDPSDIVVHTSKGRKISHHGFSLKVTDSKSASLPLSNPGLESTHGAGVHLDKHRAAIDKKFPALAKMTNKSERKAYVRSNPKVKAHIEGMNKEVIPRIAKHTATELSKLPTAHLANHIRKHVLKTDPTPMQKEGHTHTRHTTSGMGGEYKFSHVDPTTSHEHILKDHKNISVEHNGGNAVIFKHKGVAFARHRFKFESQSDPKSIVKGSGELMSGKLTEGAEQYKPEKEQLRNRIAAHKDVAELMAKRHGEKSQQASFHRALIKQWTKELGEETLDEAKKPKKQTKKNWQSQAVKAKRSNDPAAIRKALRAHSQLRKEEAVPNSVGGGMSPVIGGEGNIHGTDPIMGKPIRRKKYAGKQVFVVDPTTYHKAYLGKRKNEHYEKYLEGSPMADEIREYGRKNWDESIVIENEQTGAMVYLKYGSK